MFYAVEIRQPSDAFAEEYLNGCEQTFASFEEAQGYLSTFEDWEQPMLCINAKQR